MSFRITRRDFVTKAATAFIVSGWLNQTGCVTPKISQGTSPWVNLPPLDGTLHFEDPLLNFMAVDLGNNTVRKPVAVLQPKTDGDIIKIVKYANQHKLKVTMRGQGHSQYGQALAEKGIVIDSRTLNAVTLIGHAMVDVQTGASWDDLTRETLTHALTPPAMGDSMTLSVGGILSAGGISNSSHLYGGVVDSVREIDVVTGNGELLTCSDQKNTELFKVALAGMGQCGLITRARIRLIGAPTWVVRCDFNYNNLKDFLYDYYRLAKEGKYEHLGAYVLPRSPNENWKFRINIGKFCGSVVEYNPSQIANELRAISRDEPEATPFADYLHRAKKRIDTDKERWKNTPTHLLISSFFLPESVSEEFISGMLSSTAETEKMLRLSLYLLPTHKLNRPMFMIPKESHTLCVFLFHEVPVADNERYGFMVDTVKKLSARVQASSGKLYPPYAPFFTKSDWKNHYEQKQWSILTAAKQKYDPNGTLTPGMDSF